MHAKVQLIPFIARAVIYLSKPRKRAQRLEKPPRYPPICVKNYKMRKNSLQPMRVQSHTLIDLRNELSDSENRLGSL